MKCRVIPLLCLLIAFGGAAFASDRVVITLLHTNDLHGRVMPQGEPGLAKIATIVRGIRANMPNVLLVDAGDCLNGGYEDYLSAGRATISAMNTVGYTAGVPGNHEFDFGPEIARRAFSAAAFPMLAANMVDRSTGKSWDGLDPYRIVEVEGVSIAFFGLTTDEAVALQWPPSVAQIRIEDPIATAETLVPKLRAMADVVVLLSHLGNDVDKKIARKVPGIDFIIGGHSHTAVKRWQWVGDTLVSQAGVYGAYLGRIDFEVEKSEEGATITWINGRDGESWDRTRHRPLGKRYPGSPLIKVRESIVDDPASVEVYKPFLDKAEQQLSEVIGQAPEAIPSGPQSLDESPAGNLVADAVRAYAKSDISVVDTRSVSKGLAAGPVTVRDAFDMIGGFTRQRVVVVRMKGSQITSLLPSKLLEDSALRLQVSGLALSYRPTGSERVEISNVSVNGVPIDPEKDYTIAGQAYIIQGFISRLPNLPVLAEPGGTTREAIVDHIRSLGKLNPSKDQRLPRAKP